MNSENDAVVYANLEEAVRQAAECPIVTKYLVIAEAIDEDGDRCIMWLSSEHMSMWDKLGMMSFETARIKAQIAGVHGDDDE